MSARLRDFIVLNVDPKSIHKKVSQLCDLHSPQTTMERGFEWS